MYLDPRTVIAIEELASWVDEEPRKLEVTQHESRRRGPNGGVNVMLTVGERRLMTFVPNETVHEKIGDQWLDHACDRLMKGLFLQLIDACESKRKESSNVTGLFAR